MQPIDIVVVTYFRKEFTKKCLEHLLQRTRTPFRLIVVDNGSKDGTTDMLYEMAQAYQGMFKQIVPLGRNAGLEAAKNIGMEYVESELFVDTDNDILCPDLEPDWLARMVDLMQKYPEFGAIAMRPQVLVGVGPIFAGAREVVPNNVCGGSLRIMRKKLVKEVGGWRDEFTNRSEEWHICGRIRQKGLKVGYARDLFCYHMFGEGENWGYPKDVDHYHNPNSKQYARDVEYDPVTMIPKFKTNE